MRFFSLGYLCIEASQRQSNTSQHLWVINGTKSPPLLLADRLSIKADVEPHPEQIQIKGLLKRIVQIAKCHRELMFANDRRNCAPISIIITTLAAHAYADAVRNGRL